MVVPKGLHFLDSLQLGMAILGLNSWVEFSSLGKGREGVAPSHLGPTREMAEQQGSRSLGLCLASHSTSYQPTSTPLPKRNKPLLFKSPLVWVSVT